jgi:predicted nucleic acid-binding protein
VDAFDSDVLIYAASATHPHAPHLRRLFRLMDDLGRAGVGSVALLPEVLAKPLRLGHDAEVTAMEDLLARLELQPVDRATANAATALGAKYRLRALDAIHLATAVLAGADRFLTNNRRDFPKTIEEVDVTYPDDLPE